MLYCASSNPFLSLTFLLFLCLISLILTFANLKLRLDIPFIHLFIHSSGYRTSIQMSFGIIFDGNGEHGTSQVSKAWNA